MFHSFFVCFFSSAGLHGPAREPSLCCDLAHVSIAANIHKRIQIGRVRSGEQAVPGCWVPCQFLSFSRLSLSKQAWHPSPGTHSMHLSSIYCKQKCTRRDTHTKTHTHSLVRANMRVLTVSLVEWQTGCFRCITSGWQSTVKWWDVLVFQSTAFSFKWCALVSSGWCLFSLFSAPSIRCHPPSTVNDGIWSTAAPTVLCGVVRSFGIFNYCQDTWCHIVWPMDFHLFRPHTLARLSFLPWRSNIFMCARNAFDRLSERSWAGNPRVKRCFNYGSSSIDHNHHY